MWSSPTLVTTATPPSHACVASSRPPRPDLDQGDVEPRLREVAEHHGGQELELGRRPEPRRDAVGDGQDVADEPGERAGVDRAAVDDDPLAVGDEMWLGRLADAIAGGPERGPGQRDHAALAVGAGDQRAADRQLRVAHRSQEGPDASEPEAHPVAATRLDRRQRLGIGEVRGAGRGLSLAAGTHDFVSSSS